MGHLWTHHPSTGWTYCSACGVVRRSDAASKPCPGAAKEGSR